MADANLTVFEPGEAELPVGSTIPPFMVDLEVALGDRRQVRLDISEAGIGSVCDMLHRIGGEPLLRELSRALGNRMREGNFDDARLASTGIRLAEQQTKVLRSESMAYIEALDASARQLFEHDLTLAAVALQPQNFGFEVDQDGTRSVPESGLAHDLYRQLRSVVTELDGLRRNVRQWANISLPQNAREARRQFKEYFLEPYTMGMARAAERYPALLVLAPPILKELAKESLTDIESWEADEANTTRLDEVIQNTIVDAFNNLREKQPEFRDRMLRMAEGAVKSARENVTRYWLESPAQILGSRHPLWKHPFLIHAAVEQQGYRPGDHGYAVAMDSLDAAMAAEERSRQETAEIDRLVGWASLGFGVLTMVPVVGQLALAAVIGLTAIRALEEGQRYLSETSERQSLGHQAVQYQVPEPDALGLILDVLQLTADAALPVVGKLLSKTVLRPTTRVIAATRVKTVLFVGERSADLAGFAISANTALVETELRKLQLLTVETGRK